MKGRVLIIAGSDSGGGAGIQADIKTVTALLGYAMTAVTALTAQNTLGVTGIHPVPDEFVALQIKVVLDDLGADAVKTGMLATPGCIETVALALQPLAGRTPIVVDPVMVAKGGQALSSDAAQLCLKQRLLPLATILTPNVPEAEALTGQAIRTLADMGTAGRALLEAGAQAVLVKGGHMPGDIINDLLVTRDGERCFTSERVRTEHTHGTGCTLASAIATGLAQGLALEAAVDRARRYVAQAIRKAPRYGQGHGPLGHTHTVKPFP